MRLFGRDYFMERVCERVIFMNCDILKKLMSEYFDVLLMLVLLVFFMVWCSYFI